MAYVWDNTYVFEAKAREGVRHCGPRAPYAYHAYCGLKLLHAEVRLSTASSDCLLCEEKSKMLGKPLK